MVPYGYLARLWRLDKSRLGLCGIVTLASVIEDPVVGLLIGMFVAYVANAKLAVDGKTVCHVYPLPKPKAFKVVINGPVTYITGEQVQKALKQLIGHAEVVVVNMAAVTEVDTDGVAFLEAAVGKLAAADCELFFAKVP